jgi:ABC-type histidine transport system ATPase subunit
MDKGEIVEYGPPTILDKPASEQLQEFMHKLK